MYESVHGGIKAREDVIFDIFSGFFVINKREEAMNKDWNNVFLVGLFEIG